MTQLRSILTLFCLVSFASPLAGRAAQYEVEIEITDELDLQELAEKDEISPETYETLLDLLHQGVDINSASRDELYSLPNVTYDQVDALIEYRKLTGHIEDPLALVQAGVLSDEALRQIAPFLIIGERGAQVPVSGWAKFVGRGAVEDPLTPPGYLQLRVHAPWNLSFGLAATSTRQRIGPVSYDPTRNTTRPALVAPAPRYGLEIPKYYGQWRSSQSQVIAGTFRAGFGERLTLDNTSRYTPNGFYRDTVMVQRIDLGSGCQLSTGELDGSPCALDGSDGQRVVPDFRWRDGFRGVGGGVENLEINANTRASLFGFGSYQTRSILSTQTYDFGRCESPRNDTSESCKGPSVYVAGTSPAATYRPTSLPSVVDEMTLGAHAGLTFHDRTELGITGFYAVPRWTVSGLRLDFQEWSPFPFQGPFGAVGIDGSTRFGPVNSFIEVARSFDSQKSFDPGTAAGGGFAVVQRNAIELAKKQELEVSLRYYDRNFANPYARPISAPDQFEGNRARNEAGLRIKYLAKSWMDWRLRAGADLWTLPQDTDAVRRAGRTSLDTQVRADYSGWSFIRLASWVRHTNKDLRRGGYGRCYGGSGLGFDADYDGEGSFETGAEDLFDGEGVVDPSEIGEEGEVPGSGCAGERYTAAGRIEGNPWTDKVELSLQLQQAWVTSSNYADSFQVDQSAWVGIVARPVQPLVLSARVRLRDVDSFNAARGERSTWGVFKATWRPSRRLYTTLRYDFWSYTDERTSTERRRPNPAHVFQVQLESRF